MLVSSPHPSYSTNLSIGYETSRGRESASIKALIISYLIDCLELNLSK